MLRLPAMALVALGTLAGKAPAQINWGEDFEKGQKVAEGEGRGMLVLFTGTEWCYWCQRLEAEVLAQKAFGDWAQGLVPVRVVFPSDSEVDGAAARAAREQLADRCGVRGFPTVVITDRMGRPVGAVGYRADGPEAYVKELESLEQRIAPFEKAMATVAESAEAGPRAAALTQAMDVVGRELAMRAHRKQVEWLARLPEDPTQESEAETARRLRFAAWLEGEKLEETVQARAMKADWKGLVESMGMYIATFEKAKTKDLLQQALFFRGVGHMELQAYADAKASFDQALAQDGATEMARQIRERILPMVQKRLKDG